MKKKKIVLFVFLGVGVLAIILTYKFKQNGLSKNNPIKEEKLSIMIKEDGATDYTKSSSKDIPKGNYTLNKEKTYCENNGEVMSYDNVNGVVGFSFIGSDKCYLYFDYSAKLYDTIAKRYQNNDNFVKNYNGADYGDTTNYANNIYYFNGAVENNNVLFGGYCWKIVRTTGTGGVKMIYNGRQKNVADLNLFELTQYKNLINNSQYPYTFDETNKTWTSTNTGTNSSAISFNVPENGDFALNYDVSTYANINDMNINIYKDSELLGSYVGNISGQIILDNLSTSNTIKVVFTRNQSYTSGTRNNVIFSFGKTINKYKSCNNTYYDAQIAFSPYNEEQNSLAYAGYMYNIAYEDNYYEIMDYMTSSNVTMFGTSVSYSNGLYSLVNPTSVNITTSSDLSTFVGKYVCSDGSSTSCKKVRYIFSTSGRQFNYFTLKDGITNGSYYDIDYVFGKSFTYANGKYVLTDTITVNAKTWRSNYKNIDDYHFTCYNSSNTCSSIYYINYKGTSNISAMIISNGKSIDNAINEMLYADDVNKNDSAIKKVVDAWYENNMINYTDKLEDTIYCNDRSNTDLGSWSLSKQTTGDSFKYKNNDVTYSLFCENINDRFTVNISNGNGALTYPVGLLSAPEAHLATKDVEAKKHYLYTGYGIWLQSPVLYQRILIQSTLYDTVSQGTAMASIGVKPVISLKPGTIVFSGNGSYTKPYIIN